MRRPARSRAEEGPAPAGGSVQPPVVAIVGRPNVGKSTLLNALVRSRIAIVEPTPGVTRDRVGVLTTLGDRTVEVVDTAGLGMEGAEALSKQVLAQVRRAIETAAVILFVVDAREGVASLDRRVAEFLRRASDRVILVANKAETSRAEWNLAEFEALGHGTPLAISAKEQVNVEELRDRIAGKLPAGPTTPARLAPPAFKLAVVGRTNAGKSSFVNALLKDERMIVSEIPGTTRDSVDVRFERDGEALVVIDTAGIRKERSVQGGAEFYAQRRAEKAMRRADVTVLMLDAATDVGRLDRRIAGYALAQHHPVVIVANKWDLRPHGVTKSSFVKYLRANLGGFEFAPIVFTSAAKGRGIDAVLAAARRLDEQASHRVSTPDVNRALRDAQRLRAPRPRKGRVGTIYYGTQVEVKPPTFVLFANDPALFDDTYMRYLQNRFRVTLPFREVPIRFRLKGRPKTPSRSPGRAQEEDS